MFFQKIGADHQKPYTSSLRAWHSTDILVKIILKQVAHTSCKKLLLFLVGNFGYIDSREMDRSDKADLQVPGPFIDSPVYCLRLYYHMYGRYTERVYLRLGEDVLLFKAKNGCKCIVLQGILVTS